eukprot:GHVP01016111.1.p1 GENE.GHVP01016111.1~~GHVP01016111.1.p1  ORF type:complete len:169 (+),score=22.65 GHVP01016111.1:318-824(+)
MRFIKSIELVWVYVYNQAIYILMNNEHLFEEGVEYLIININKMDMKQEILNLGKIHTKQIGTLILYDNSIYLLEHIISSQINKIESIQIDIIDYINIELIRNLNIIKISSVKIIRINNKGLYILDKLKIIENYKIFTVIIDSNDSKIDLELIKEMNSIELGRIERLFI